MSMQPVRPLEERLQKLPQGRLAPEGEQRLRLLCRDLDRVARRDEETQEIYVHEPTLRALFRKHSPPRFAEGYLRMIKDSPDGHLLRSSRPGSQETIIPIEAAARAAGIARPEETPEAIGLTPDSSADDIRRAFQSRVPNLPDSMFTPEVGDRLRQAVHHLDDSGPAEADASELAELETLQSDYFTRVKQCFGTRAGIWWEIATVMFIWTFFVLWPWFIPEPITAAVTAIFVAGIFVLAWLLWSLVYCLVAALFG